MKVNVLPFDELKAKRDDFDVLVTVLSPIHKSDPQFSLTANGNQTLVQTWARDHEYGPEAPTFEQIEQLLSDMLDVIGTDKRVGIACTAGVSRSSATALMLLAAETGDVNRAFQEWLSDPRSGLFWPNARIIEHADELLQFNGRLIEKVKSFKQGPGKYRIGA